MKKLIIFDLDGTLLDTLQDLTNSVNYAMRELGLPLFTAAQVRDMIGNGVSVLMLRAVVARSSAELHSQALALQRKYYAEHTNDFAKPYDGILDMLSTLKNEGFVAAVHTNKDEDCAKILCRQYFGRLIDYVCGTTDYAVTKPNPIKISSLLERLGIASKNAVYCGDSEVDVQTAYNAGLPCISVTWGFRDEQFLKNVGAKHLASCPQEVIDLAVELTHSA